MCILGGGFGGLYTALRLESLLWPDDKKPQVSCIMCCLLFDFMFFRANRISKDVGGFVLQSSSYMPIKK